MSLLLIEADELIHRKSAGAQRAHYVFLPTSGKEPIVFDKGTWKTKIPDILETKGYKWSNKKQLVQAIKDQDFENNPILDTEHGQIKRDCHTIVAFETVTEWVKEELEAYCKYCHIDNYELWISPPRESNFRFHIATTQPYKGNRVGKPKPIYYARLKTWLEENYFVQIALYEEADDAVMWRHHQVPGSIIVAQDKDFWASAKVIYDPVKGVIKELSSIMGTLEMSDKGKLVGDGLSWFYAQMLLGDTADNIPGIPKMGSATIFSSYTKFRKGLRSELTEKHLIDWCYRIYRKNLKKYDKLNEEAIYKRFLEVADLLWIRTAPGVCKSQQIDAIMVDMYKGEKCI